MSYSDTTNQPEGFVETPFVNINEGDVFMIQGDTEVYKAKSSTKLSEDFAFYELQAETVDFDLKTLRIGRTQFGYAPKFYVSTGSKMKLKIDGDLVPKKPAKKKRRAKKK